MHSQASLHSSHEHSLCLLWQRHSLGQGSVPRLLKYLYDKIPDKMEMPQGWPTQLQPDASYDHHTPCLGTGRCAVTYQEQTHTRPAHGLSQDSMRLSWIVPSFYCVVAEDTLQLSERKTQSNLDPKSGAELLLSEKGSLGWPCLHAYTGDGKIRHNRRCNT